MDKITGGGALDFLIGGQQPNTLTAGSGSEVFAASGNDTIVLNGLSFSDDIIYQLTPTDQIDLTSLLLRTRLDVGNGLIQRHHNFACGEQWNNECHP